MNKQKSDQTLDAQVNKLPKAMQPQRDLWPGIERAIQDKSQEDVMVAKSNYKLPMAWAASFIVAVLVAWFSFSPTKLMLSTPLVATTNEALQSDDGSLISLMKASFQQQKQEMLVSYGQPDLTNLPEKMLAQLFELSQARKTIEKALTSDKNNVDLLNLLRFTQQQELNLLQQLYPFMDNQNIQWQTI
jgi:hypothetical protein